MPNSRTIVGKRGHPVKNSVIVVFVGILAGNTYGALKGVTEVSLIKGHLEMCGVELRELIRGDEAFRD